MIANKMPTSANFTPNATCAPCIYCGEKKDATPDQFLRCSMCKQCAHLACLKSGRPLNRLKGDNFFSFTCLYCSLNSEELVTRVNISILHAMLIAMYNLHTSCADQATDGYFHYKKDIHAFMVNHWNELFAYEGKKLSFKDKTKIPPSCISGQLSQAAYFKRATQTARGGWYRLICIKCPSILIEKYGPTKRKVIESGRDDANKRTKLNDSVTKNFVKSLNGICVKSEGSEESAIESIDDNSSRGSWFTDRSYMTPMQKLPSSILEDDDDDLEMKSESPKLDFNNLNSQINQNVNAKTVKGPRSYFPDHDPMPDTNEEPDLVTYVTENKPKNLISMNKYEEHKLLNELDGFQAISDLPPHLYRLRRKLKVRKAKREHGLPVFNIDEEVKFCEDNSRLMTNEERLVRQAKDDFTYSFTNNNTDLKNILDRFQIFHPDDNSKDQGSLRTKLIGSSNDRLDYIHSPYSLKKLRPYIFRDKTAKPSKLKLMEDIISYPHRKDSSWKPPLRPSIDYCYVTHKHIPAMNQLARQFFWPGIELSEVLKYPDFTCVVIFGKLVIGFGIVVPNTKHNEAYISFLLVHPEWRRAGIGKFMLYHLLQTCAGKDVTLHVSADNPASIMYQQFGFKVEEFLVNFYDKYFHEGSIDCKHAMYLRLNR